MDRNYAAHRYTTKVVSDHRDGFTALELHRTLCRDPADSPKRVAQVVFWDAAGQFFIETFGEDIPVDIAQDLIAEAKSVIRVR
jgi:hypothetical protein